MIYLIKEKGYIDVTKEWLDKATPNSHIVIDRTFYNDSDENIYYVDGKNVILDYSKEELEIAKWLESTFGGKIYMLPKIKKPNGIKTADYIFNGILLDLKKLSGSSKTFLDDGIKRAKKQSNKLNKEYAKLISVVGQGSLIFFLRK